MSMTFGLILIAVWIVIMLAAIATYRRQAQATDRLFRNKYKLLLALSGMTCILLSYWMMWATSYMDQPSSKVKVGAYVGGTFIIAAGLPQVICALVAENETCRKFLNFIFRSNEENRH